MIRLLLILFLAAGVFAAGARADTASTSYLEAVTHGDSMDVTWSIALRDLDAAIGLDSNGDGAITWGEMRAQAGKISTYALTRLRITASGAPCREGEPQLLADQIGGAAFAVLRFPVRCPAVIDQLAFAYSLLFELDARHRGLIHLTLNDVSLAGSFAPAQREVSFAAAAGSGSIGLAFFRSGVGHLFGGADHLLFIAMLVLPAMLRVDPIDGTLARLGGVIRLLSAFTLAHGVTLTLAVLQIVTVPPRVAEPAIALTILLTALDNLHPFLPGRRMMLAFGFGLVHGMSVAGGLGPLHLPPGLLALALLSFSFGIEAAQLLIAVGFAPVAACLRATRPASWRMLPVLSGAAAVIAIGWLK